MLPNKKALKIIEKYIKIYDGKNEDEIKRSLIKDLLKNDVLVKTKDGTFTLKAESEDELMHSNIGALTESICKFVEPSNIASIKQPKILDLCSGLGYNATTALHYNKNAHIDMVEVCEEVLFLTLFLDIPYKEHEIIKDKVREYFLNKKGIEYASNFDNVHVYVMDAREFICKKKTDYHAIFHDAFSPKRDPTLYTYDFLEMLFFNTKKGGVLISYSSSIPFRSALVDCGFEISEKESVGRKRGITLAYKCPNFDVDRVNRTDERVIALSTTALPYRDESLSLSSLEIENFRRELRKKLKDDLIKMDKFISTKRIKKGKVPDYILNIQEEALSSSKVIKKMRSEFFGDEKFFIKFSSNGCL
ncbi:MAG: hypothetical protein GXN95_00235 [Methanococci archaeon]|nr:hypothetical protein [Methanococci archaeon]